MLTIFLNEGEDLHIHLIGGETIEQKVLAIWHDCLIKNNFNKTLFLDSQIIDAKDINNIQLTLEVSYKDALGSILKLGKGIKV